MKAARKKRLESAGWRVGTAGEFLGLSPEESQLVEMKLALGESLRRHRMKKRLTQPFVVMNGDILSLIDFSKFYTFALRMNTLLTIAIKKLVTPYAFGNIFFEGDCVTRIEEKPDIITYALAGIYVMKPEILKYIPTNQNSGMDLLILNMLQQKVPIAKYEMAEYWLDIGQLSDFEKAQSIYDTHFKEQIEA